MNDLLDSIMEQLIERYGADVIASMLTKHLDREQWLEVYEKADAARQLTNYWHGRMVEGIKRNARSIKIGDTEITMDDFGGAPWDTDPCE